MGFSILRNKMIIYCAFMACLIMVAFPEVTATASKEAIRLWLNAVVPTLFPFIIMANFIKQTGIVCRFPTGIYPFIMALLSGYPMGAKLSGDAYRDHWIDEMQLQRILSYSMVTGPAFIVGAVGVTFFHSQTLGYILAASHYVGAIINGVIHGGVCLRTNLCNMREGMQRESYYTCLTDSILDGFKTIGMILAYIMMFMIGTDLIQFTGIFALFKTDYHAAFVKGFFEMTLGCNAIYSCQCSVMKKLVLTSFLISFGGLSVLGQSMSMLKNCPVSSMQLLKLKLSHGIISAILTFTIYSFVV